MATSIEYDMVAEVEKETSCPICLEEFEEPKCLPSCAHNACQHCLEGMVKKRNDVIECPVCRVESNIPRGGVAAFPKNHLLVRLIERTPGRKEKKVIREAIKRCKEKVEGATTAIKEMEDRYQTANTRDEEIRQRIKSLADDVVTKVREQEQKMLHQMQLRENRREKSFGTLKSSCAELCENASSCIQTAESALQIGELERLRSVEVEGMNDISKSLGTKISEANCEFTQATDVSLTNTDLATDVVEMLNHAECLLGKLKLNYTGSAHQNVSSGSCTPACVPAPVTSRGVDFSRCGSVIKTIDSSSCQIPAFNPFSVATCRHSGDFVTLDRATNWVHIFDEDGEYVDRFYIKFGDLWDIAVSNNNEIVVVNRTSNRLLHYDMFGNFKKKFVTPPQENVKFTSLSVDIHGRFILTSCSYDVDEDEDDDYADDYDDYDDDCDEGILPCILVYSPSGNLTLSFDDGVARPHKAVFLNGKLFVTDSDMGGVMVFDKYGECLNKISVHEWGDHQLGGIAADHKNGNLVVCDKENNTIHIFSQTGCLLHHFRTAHRPVEVAFTEDYAKLLICCEVDSDKSYILMVTYL